MDSIGIRELRQNASRYVQMARDGQRVAVTDRGRLVAYLVPADESSSLVDRLDAAGQYTRPVGSILDLLPAPGDAGREPLSAVVEDMRAEERW